MFGLVTEKWVILRECKSIYPPCFKKWLNYMGSCLHLEEIQNNLMASFIRSGTLSQNILGRRNHNLGTDCLVKFLFCIYTLGLCCPSLQWTCLDPLMFWHLGLLRLNL